MPVRAGAVGLWLIVPLLGVSARAFAQGSKSDPCLTAPVEGQKLQRAGKLLEARQSFATCARSTCPGVVSKACKRWLSQVNADVPSVRLSARDDHGQELRGIQVSIDGKPAVPLASSPVELDPGKHKFVFHSGGSADQTRYVVLEDDGTTTQVSVTFPSAPPPERSESSPHVEQGTQKKPGEPKRPVPVASWVLGGVGSAALLGFATFGTLGLVQRGSSNCAQSAPPSTFDSCQTGVHDKFRGADISLAIGVVALGAATWLYVERPTVKEGSAALAVGVAPTARGAVATVRTTF